MPQDPLDRLDGALGRRRFLQVGAAGALVCTIGGTTVEVGRRGDAAKADAAAAQVRRPEPVDAQRFPTPEPQPGGRVVEHWIQARAARWDIVPTGRDDWHGQAIRARSAFRALVFQEMTPGFAAPRGRPAIPGPTLRAEVGDVLRVHFRNALPRDLGQAVTMHPHGLRYTPDYDGIYLGAHTRAGGFVAPGEEFTYTWECPPDSTGAWPYHDHGPNHMLNTMRGLFGAVVVRPKGDRVPQVEHALFLHELPPTVTGLRRSFQCINGRAYAGNTPTLRARQGDTVALHVIGMDDRLHDFHLHGHRWTDASGANVDTPLVGPTHGITARFVEDNPGRWLYHCHVLAHQDAGMAGWYLVA